MSHEPNESTENPLLKATQAAIERGDLERADALFLDHFNRNRNDPVGLAHYGIFCLRTGRAPSACYLLDKATALRPGQAEWLSPLGYARLEMKDFESAQRAFEAAIALAPEYPQANYGLGLCAAHERAWDAAISAFAKALASPTDTIPVLLQLADACHRAGEQAKARTHYERALRESPDYPASLLAFGTFLRECGEASAAMILIDRCGARNPNEPRLLLEKARCLRALGDTTHALRWLQRLQKDSPDFPGCDEEIGNCLPAPSDRTLRERHWLKAIASWTRSGEFGLASDLLDRLLTANPISVDGWHARGTLESKRHRLDMAEAAWRKAVEIDPSRLGEAASLALLLENSNRVAESKSVGEHVLQSVRRGVRHPGEAELLLALCKVARRQKEYVRGVALLDRIDALAPTEPQRLFANFERGKLMDLLDDPAQAIDAFATGNALAHAQWLKDNPGRNKALGGVDYMIDLVGKGWLREWKPIEALPHHPDVAFLIGFPRSGTTLLNQVLDSHEAIHAIEEKPTVAKIMESVRNMPGDYPQALADLDAFDVGYLRDAYLRATAEHGAVDPSKLILDKFPMNTNLAGLLHRVFPQARFVFALRHPCDVLLSCFMQSFDLNNTMANFCTLADAVALYVKTMDLWQMYCEQLPLNVHTIRYEDVVDDFDGQTRALCEFLGVAWKSDLREFSTKALARGHINTPSYEQVSRPIYREARFRWERYRDHLAPYLPALQPYIERFGYGEATTHDVGRIDQLRC